MTGHYLHGFRDVVSSILSEYNFEDLVSCKRNHHANAQKRARVYTAIRVPSVLIKELRSSLEGIFV